MLRLLYIASSSFSGSTLLAFLLNTHPDIFTVGEMEGWNYGPSQTFHCSCGETLTSCQFFRSVADTFRKEGLPFNTREFGTRYRLVSNEHINRYLTDGLPRLSSSRWERVRDAVLHQVPTWSKKLAQQDRANLAFIRSALSYSGASVFADASKDPYRLRHLRRIREIDLSVLYLVRDPRGIALSNLRKRGWNPRLCTRLWVREQSTILRISGEFSKILTVYYENLCDDVADTLARIEGFLNLAPHSLPEDLKTVENHILGNVMRLRELRRVTRDTRWERELSGRDQDLVRDTALAECRRYRADPVCEVIRHYIP